jgi:hypothetical protein
MVKRKTSSSHTLQDKMENTTVTEESDMNETGLNEEYETDSDHYLGRHLLEGRFHYSIQTFLVTLCLVSWRFNLNFRYNWFPSISRGSWSLNRGKREVGSMDK